MKKLFMGVLFALCVSLSGHAWAANNDNPVDGIFKGAYGDTISVEVPSTVSKSPDNLASGDLTFMVNSNTGYKGFNQLTDLKAGDPVQVEYTIDERSQKMLATVISRSNSQSVTKTTTTSTTTSTSLPETTNSTMVNSTY